MPGCVGSWPCWWASWSPCRAPERRGRRRTGTAGDGGRRRGCWCWWSGSPWTRRWRRPGPTGRRWPGSCPPCPSISRWRPGCCRWPPAAGSTPWPPWRATRRAASGLPGPAAVERIRADNPGARLGRLPPTTRVLAYQGQEVAGAAHPGPERGRRRAQPARARRPPAPAAPRPAARPGRSRRGRPGQCARPAPAGGRCDRPGHGRRAAGGARAGQRGPAAGPRRPARRRPAHLRLDPPPRPGRPRGRAADAGRRRLRRRRRLGHPGRRGRRRRRHRDPAGPPGRGPGGRPHLGDPAALPGRRAGPVRPAGRLARRRRDPAGRPRPRGRCWPSPWPCRPATWSPAWPSRSRPGSGRWSCPACATPAWPAAGRSPGSCRASPPPPS